MNNKKLPQYLQSATRAMRTTFAAVAAMSGVINVLALTGAVYMLQVYDRVLASYSVPTLVALSVLAAGLYMFQGLLDVLRAQILVQVGSRLDHDLSPVAHDALLRLPLAGIDPNNATRPIRDVENMRSFLSGHGPVAIFDMPWMPAYLAFVYILHPILGLLATAGVIVLVALTMATERMSIRLTEQATRASAHCAALADTNARNAEVLYAMGFADRAADGYREAAAKHLTLQTRVGDIQGTMSGISRLIRMMLQSAVLGTGAYLTLAGEVTAGAIIAASVATARALAPVELAIAHWRGFLAARQAYTRLSDTLVALPEKPETLDLPAPQHTLAVESVSVAIPATRHLVLDGIDFKVSSGQGLGVIGPSGSGKSTLARAMTGVWPRAKGHIRLDGASLEHWPDAYFTQHIGYLPQDVSLMDGTIAQNIARFDPAANSADIIEAASCACVHELILRLPDGYETCLGAQGNALSAGQRQRIALARALYRKPFLIVLDEPNANLDAEGDAALTKAILSVRKRGSIVIVIAHRPSALDAVSHVAMIRDGRLEAFGTRNEILKSVLRRPAEAVPA